MRISLADCVDPRPRPLIPSIRAEDNFPLLPRSSSLSCATSSACQRTRSPASSRKRFPRLSLRLRRLQLELGPFRQPTAPTAPTASSAAPSFWQPTAPSASSAPSFWPPTAPSSAPSPKAPSPAPSAKAPSPAPSAKAPAVEHGPCALSEIPLFNRRSFFSLSAHGFQSSIAVIDIRAEQSCHDVGKQCVKQSSLTNGQSSTAKA